MQKSERTTHNRYEVVIILAVSLLGIAIRSLFMDNISDDWWRCWEPWMDAIEGDFSQLASFPGDYNMPYVTLLWVINKLPIRRLYGVKILSIIFDFIGAIGLGKLAALCNDRFKYSFTCGYCIFILTPVVILNSSWWAQCDVIYVSFLIWSFYFLLKDQYIAGYILFGCAFAAKLQTVIALPLLLIFWWKKRNHSIAYWFLIPLTMEVLCIPAIIAGCSPLITLQLYMGQTDEYHMLFQWYPNIWAILQGASYWVCAKIGIVVTVGVLAVELFIIGRYWKDIDKENFPLFASWVIMTPLFLLPALHERYGMLLEIMTILLAIKESKYIWVAVALNLMSWYYYLNNVSIPEKGGVFGVYASGIIYLAAFLYISFRCVKQMHKEEV